MWVSWVPAAADLLCQSAVGRCQRAGLRFVKTQTTEVGLEASWSVVVTECVCWFFKALWMWNHRPSLWLWRSKMKSEQFHRDTVVSKPTYFCLYSSFLKSLFWGQKQVWTWKLILKWLCSLRLDIERYHYSGRALWYLHENVHCFWGKLLKPNGLSASIPRFWRACGCYCTLVCGK